MLYAGFHVAGVHLFAYQGVHVFQDGFYLIRHGYSFGGEEDEFVASVSGVFPAYDPSFFLQVVDQIGKACFILRCLSASVCWLTPCSFHRQCMTCSISKVISTLLLFSSRCIVLPECSSGSLKLISLVRGLFHYPSYLLFLGTKIWISLMLV